MTKRRIIPKSFSRSLPVIMIILTITHNLLIWLISVKTSLQSDKVVHYYFHIFSVIVKVNMKIIIKLFFVNRKLTIMENIKSPVNIYINFTYCCDNPSPPLNL